jgi:hypothetical protein
VAAAHALRSGACNEKWSVPTRMKLNVARTGRSHVRSNMLGQRCEIISSEKPAEIGPVTSGWQIVTTLVHNPVRHKAAESRR